MAKRDKPNILVIWGDDIGISNPSCYSHGLMGYRTPSIARIAKEGTMFTDSYGEQACTAARSSFLRARDVTSNTYYDWTLHNAYFIFVAQAAAAKFAETFREFPPAQKAASFTIDDALTKMNEAVATA